MRRNRYALFSCTQGTFKFWSNLKTSVIRPSRKIITLLLLTTLLHARMITDYTMVLFKTRLVRYQECYVFPGYWAPKSRLIQDRRRITKDKFSGIFLFFTSKFLGLVKSAQSCRPFVDEWM